MIELVSVPIVAESAVEVDTFAVRLRAIQQKRMTSRLVRVTTLAIWVIGIAAMLTVFGGSLLTTR